MPKVVDAKPVAELGIQHGVEVSTGRLCFAEDGPEIYLRMAYSFVAEEKIRECIAQPGVACNGMNRCLRDNVDRTEPFAVTFAKMA